MRRLLLPLSLLPFLAACVQAPAPIAVVEVPKQCHVGPDGGPPPLADRGIGGTGAPATKHADRGIGGTGAPATLVADRGIGGTGITGIVSGFASVCVDGLEVALGYQAAVDIDGTPETQSALRVGQLVAIQAGPSEQAPVASRVSVRHEVSGPVEAVLRESPGLIVVAGQRVRVPGKAAGSLLVQPGVWVSVSGLRGPDGDIIASRLDARQPGRVLVHGPLIKAEGVATIGSLVVQTARDTDNAVGTFVTATGTYMDGMLRADSLVPDLLVSDPPAWFGPRTTRLVLESYGQFASGGATTAGGFQAGLAAGFEPPRDLSGPMVMSLQQQSDGSFAVIRAAAAPPAGMPSVVPTPGVNGTRATPGGGDGARLNGGSAVQYGTAAMDTAETQAKVMQTSGGATSGQMAGADVTTTRDYGHGSSRSALHGSMQGGGIVYGAGGAARGAAMGGGIRLMGVGIAGHLGHGATGTFTPRMFGVHMHAVHLRPGR